MTNERREALRATRLVELSMMLMVGVALVGCGREQAELMTVRAERGGIEATVSATGTLNPVHMVEVWQKFAWFGIDESSFSFEG